MIRVSKDPDQRKAELIDTAEKLFVKYGYDEVAVSDIVRKAGVAQGTFYYHFKSKDEIREAIIDRYIGEVKVMLDGILAHEGMNALERMSMISYSFQQWGREKGKLTDHLHEEKNEVLHNRMAKKVLEYMTPAYATIIEQGIEEGIFKCEEPDLAAIVIMSMTEAIFAGEHNPKMEDEETKRKYRTLLDYTEKILGAEPDTFVKFAKEKGVDL
jgi:AcrR family transcriptional regulator